MPALLTPDDALPISIPLDTPSAVLKRLVLNRGFRILILLLTLVALSGLDLAFTLTYMLSVGMFEANPLARTLASGGDPWMLALWKIGTTTLAAWILFSHRKHWQAEVGAWICTGILVMLTVHWMHYIAHVDQFTTALSGPPQAVLTSVQPNGLEGYETGWVTMVKPD